MRRRRGLRGAAVALILAAVWVEATAQNRAPAPAEPEQPRVYRTTGSRIAIGRSIEIPADEEVSDVVVVVGGSLRVNGRVRDGLVVVGGNIALGPEADVTGDVVLVGGRLTRAEGARLHGSVSDVSFGEWSRRTFGAFSIPTVEFGDWGQWFGLLSTVFRLSLLAVLMAMVLLLARAPVARVGRAAAYEPAKAFVLGLLAEVFFLPALAIVSVVLIVTIIGIPLLVLVIPVAFFALFVAFLLGFTGLACRVGEWMEDRLGLRIPSALLATTLGTLLILAPTLAARVVGILPPPISYTGFALLLAGVVVEFFVWTMGLGAALMTGFGRWSTSPPPLPSPVQSGVATVTP